MSRWESRTTKRYDRSHESEYGTQVLTEGSVTVAAGELVDDTGIVDPRAIIPGVCESVIALADDLSKAALLLFSRSGEGSCGS